MSLNAVVANNVLFFRKKKMLSQEKFAELCGYHRTYIGAIERGERNITLATVESLCRVLEVQPYELLVARKKYE